MTPPPPRSLSVPPTPPTPPVPPSPPASPLPPTLAANPVLAAWLDFTEPGVVTIFSGKVEYGQGVWTALAQVAAEELDVDLDRVRVAPVSTATSPDEGITSGSRSIEESGSSLRQACAQARHVFLAAAADRLGVEASALGVADGEITAEAGGTGLTYWSLAGRPGPAGPGLLDREAGDPQPAKAPARWSVAGRSAARLDIPDKVAGRPRFLHDLVLPGMLYGRVIRPPAPAASLAGLRDPPLPSGVVTVRDGSFLGVVAPQDRTAVVSARAVAAAARWDVTASLPDERDLKGFLLSAPTQVVTVDERHDTGAAGPVTRTLEAEFTRPFIAHASMAPSCAVARWDGTEVTVWSHSQGVFALRGGDRGRPGPGHRPGHREPRRGGGRLRPQRRRRRRAGRGAAGPRGARAPRPGAVGAGGRAGLGAARLRHAGPAVRRARRPRADRQLAPGRVEQRLHRPPGQRRRAAAARARPSRGRPADEPSAGRPADRRHGLDPQRRPRLRHPRPPDRPAPPAHDADPDLLAPLAGRLPQRLRHRVVHG